MFQYVNVVPGITNRRMDCSIAALAGSGALAVNCPMLCATPVRTKSTPPAVCSRLLALDMTNLLLEKGREHER
jgi:hypothetical protein